MKKQPFILILLLFLFLIITAFISSAQQITYKENPLGATKEIKKALTEKALQEMMKNEGIPTYTTIKKGNGNLPVPNAICSDMGAESGWGAWTAKQGIYPGGNVTWATPIAPAVPRFNLTSGGNDLCTPGPPGPTPLGGPAVPTVAPWSFFGNASIQLGQPQKPGAAILGGCDATNSFGCAEQISFPLTVTSNNTNLIYAYALFLDEPTTQHTLNEQPYASLCILDQWGDTIPCGYVRYSGDNAATSGFYQASCPSVGSGGGTVWYKPWTIVGVDLNAYLGSTLTVIIENVDCSQGGHFAHSYWDFACPPLTGNSAPYCIGQQTTITGPASDPGNPYTYTWYQNNNPYTGSPNSTSQVITPIAQPGDTFLVHVHQASGCDFWMPFVPQPISITAAFTNTVSCGQVTFVDGSSTSSAGIPISTWNWQFPGGTPSSSTSQNPGTVTYPAGTYTATLLVTSGGCKDSIPLTFTVPPAPMATTTSTPEDCGKADGTATVAAAGGSGSYTYLWTPPVSVTATATGLSAGTYSVTITDASGCSTTSVVTITSTSSFSVTTSSTAATCKPDGSATANPVGGASPFTYVWNPAAGASATATGLGAGTYTVTVTDANGCSTTASVTITSSSSFSVTSTSTPANCTMADGSATATPAGGAIPFTYLWNPGANAAATATGLLAGTYTVTITDGNGCVETDIVMVPLSINAPVANFSSPAVCLGAPTQFTDLSTGNPNAVTWDWNFGTGVASSSLQSPSYTYTAAGTYSVTLIITTTQGCSDTITLPVTINSAPTAAFPPTAPCLGTATQLVDGSLSAANDPIVSWNWTMPAGSPASASSQNTSTLYTAAGAHLITLVVTSQSGCTDTLIQQVLVYNPPVANFAGPLKGCLPVCNTYSDLSVPTDGNITAWQWSFPGGTPASSNTKSPQTICYNTAGTYSASLIITSSYGCNDTISLPAVEAYPWPTADFCVAPAIAPATDPVFNFCDMWSSDVVQWSWDFGDNTTDLVNTDPIHSYSATATANDFYAYNICIRVENQHGCWDTTCKVVELVPEFTFYIPNTFTPNGDWLNEMFYGKSRGVKQYSIWLFDRWGNQIWNCHKEDQNTNWDSDVTLPRQEGLSSFCQWDGVVESGGADMGGGSKQLAQQDVYVWKVKLTDIFDRPHNYIGHVSVVK